ncbi:Poliovirus receptor-like protein [Larimichthys crocea]|uniref:Uncharacterized protein n=1 Tax=Larimichthys crocea TaxID=215358 RepID=A0ACD3QTF7_LARCR|nr:Poliovirus receptor-like protein [Larimichthys crocea]
METCSKSPLMLLKLLYISLLPVLEAQQVQQEVTAYLGNDVTLQCQSIPQGENGHISQFQWDLKQKEGNEITIIVSNKQFGDNTSDTFLKDRVKTEELSLKIRNVELGDAGLYTCTISTFPLGSLKRSTNLIVLEQMPLSSGEVSAIVIAVLLLLVITAAMIYLFFIRRSDSTVRHRVYIDANGPVMDAARSSVIVKQEDVVYSDVKLKPFRDGTRSSVDKHTESTRADDVTYSEVVVLYRQPK